MDRDTFDNQVDGIAALEHPISRRIYRLVIDRDSVSRDAAADALAIARSVAAFHLDKLVDAGLLLARFERTSGRTGPGAGRPAKIYGRSDHEINLSLPPRHYDLAGGLLADAISRAVSGDILVERALADVARETGARMGAQAGQAGIEGCTQDGTDGHASPRASLMEVLTRHGYEPRAEGAEIALVNCPFHHLAEQHSSLICGMNLDFVSGLIDGSPSPHAFCARLAPQAGHCCVRIDSLSDQDQPVSHRS